MEPIILRIPTYPPRWLWLALLLHLQLALSVAFGLPVWLALPTVAIIGALKLRGSARVLLLDPVRKRAQWEDRSISLETATFVAASPGGWLREVTATDDETRELLLIRHIDADRAGWVAHQIAYACGLVLDTSEPMRASLLPPQGTVDAGFFAHTVALTRSGALPVLALATALPWLVLWWLLHTPPLLFAAAITLLCGLLLALTEERSLTIDFEADRLRATSRTLAGVHTTIQMRAADLLPAKPMPGRLGHPTLILSDRSGQHLEIRHLSQAQTEQIARVIAEMRRGVQQIPAPAAIPEGVQKLRHRQTEG